MRFDRLMWLFGALFLIFGAALLVVDESEWQRWLVGLSTFALGCFALAMAGDGLSTGRIRLQNSLIMRTAQPLTFWFVICLVLLAGVGTLITSLWATFFKAW